MKPKIARKWLLLMGVLGICLVAARVSAEETTVLKTDKEKASYGIGVDVGRNFKKQGIEVDLDPLVKGLKDGLSGEKLLLPDKDLHKIMVDFQTELRRKQMQAAKVAALDNKKAGDAFLAENKKKEGVVTLPSGLQYKLLKAGDGKKPTVDDTVECRYRGTLINGTEFDATDPGGPPATFKLAAVITGWKEALKLMPIGSKWQLFIPPELAYGERGAGGRIGPNETLVFEVELLGIK